MSYSSYRAQSEPPSGPMRLPDAEHVTEKFALFSGTDTLVSASAGLAASRAGVPGAFRPLGSAAGGSITCGWLPYGVPVEFGGHDGEGSVTLAPSPDGEGPIQVSAMGWSMRMISAAQPLVLATVRPSAAYPRADLSADFAGESSGGTLQQLLAARRQPVSPATPFPARGAAGALAPEAHLRPRPRPPGRPLSSPSAIPPAVTSSGDDGDGIASSGDDGRGAPAGPTAAPIPPPRISPAPFRGMDSKSQDLQRRQAHASVQAQESILALAARFPRTVEAIYGRAALDSILGDPAVLDDLAALPYNVLLAVCRGTAAQLTAYRIVVNSVHHDQHSVSTGQHAASQFRTDALADICFYNGIRAGRIKVSPDWIERVTLCVPIGQLAFLAAAAFRPVVEQRLDKVLLAAVEGLSVVDASGRLRFNGLEPVRAALADVRTAGTRCDWQAVGEALACCIAPAKSVPYMGEAPGGSELDWQRHANRILSAVSSSRRGGHAITEEAVAYFLEVFDDFSLALAQDAAFLPAPTPAPRPVRAAAAGHLSSPEPVDPAGAGPPPASPSPSSPELLVLINSLASMPALLAAAVGGARHPLTSGRPARGAHCWTPGCPALMQPRWTACVKCSTPRPGAWVCNECNVDHPGETPACYVGCPGRKDTGTALVVGTAAFKRVLESAVRRADGARRGRGAPAPRAYLARVVPLPDDALVPLLPARKQLPPPPTAPPPQPAATVPAPARSFLAVTSAGLTVTMTVTVLAGAPFLLQQRALEVAGIDVVGSKFSHLRDPGGTCYPLHNDAAGKLLARVRLITLGDGGPALLLRPHRGTLEPGDFEVQLDNGCEVTIIPADRTSLVHSHSPTPGPSIAGAVAGSIQRSIGSGQLRIVLEPAPAPPPVGPAPADSFAMLARRLLPRHARPFARPQLTDCDAVARRFNILNREQLRSMPSLLGGIGPLRVQDDVAIGGLGVLHKAAARSPPIHRHTSTASDERRSEQAIGTVWWVDITPPRQPDYDGHTVAFMFYEDQTGYPFAYLSPRKGTDAFVGSIAGLERELALLCPGTILKMIRGDFDSSWGVQGRVGDTLPAALKVFCSARPHLSIVPVAPHSQALNRAELSQQRVNVYYMANHVRSQLGLIAWGDMLRNAAFSFAHQNAPGSASPALRTKTRYTALTGHTLDATGVAGFGGEFGWRILDNGKAGMLRERAAPMYYIMAARDNGAHWVRDLATGDAFLTRKIIMGDGATLLHALAARPGVGRPSGLLGRPPATDYEQRIDALIKVWDPDALQFTALEVNPITGMPLRTVSYIPSYTTDGKLVAIRLPVSALPSSGPPPVSSSYTRVPHITHASGRCSLGAATMHWFTALPSTTPIQMARSDKSPGTATDARFAIYKHAATKGDLEPITGQRRRDVMWDLAHGTILVSNGAAEPTSAAAHSVLAPLPVPPALDDFHTPATSLPGVNADRLHLVDSLELVDRAGTARLAASLAAADAELRTLKDIAREESKEDNPHAADADGGSALHASLFDDSSSGAARAMLARALAAELAAEDLDALDAPLLLSAYAASSEGIATPTTIREMEQHPRYEGKNGWLEDLQRELTKNFSPNVEVVLESEYFANLDKHGPDRVSISYIVPAFREKQDCAGEPTKCRVRLTCAERKRRARRAGVSVAPVVPDRHAYFAGCADSTTNRTVAQVALILAANQTTDDVSGAYWKGRPPSLAEGGRIVYAYIPEWLTRHGAGAFPARDAEGRRLIIHIRGNMPGRRDAGKIWQQRFDEFLLAFGFTPTSFDPRCFVLVAHDGTLILHVHVDDGRLTYSTRVACDRYRLAWAKEFDEELGPLGETDFTGLRHSFIGEGSQRRCEITCGGVIKNLASLLAEHEFAANLSKDIPMATDAPRNLLLAPSAANPLRPDLLTPARCIGGTIGFVVTMVKAEAYLAFCILSRYLNEQRLTCYAFECLLRLGHYLVTTKDLALTLRWVPAGTELEAWVDSSLGGIADGRSQGGAFGCFRSSGALFWTSSAPSTAADASGAMELHQGVRCVKAVTGLRILLRELCLPPTCPTLTHTDSTTLIDGMKSNRVSKESKWVCTRLAMTRSYEANSAGKFVHVGTDENPADLLTKPLTGAKFIRFRASILGLDP